LIDKEENNEKLKHQIHIDVKRAMNTIDYYVNLTEEQV